MAVPGDDVGRGRQRRDGGAAPAIAAATAIQIVLALMLVLLVLVVLQLVAPGHWAETLGGQCLGHHGLHVGPLLLRDGPLVLHPVSHGLVAVALQALEGRLAAGLLLLLLLGRVECEESERSLEDDEGRVAEEADHPRTLLLDRHLEGSQALLRGRKESQKCGEDWQCIFGSNRSSRGC